MLGKTALVMLSACIAAAPAQAQCWSEQDINTAKLSDMQAMLGVMAVRCEGAGHSIRGAYDAYLSATHRTIAITNQRMKSRFWTLYGAQEGQRRFDAFTMRLSDGYMRVAAVAENCDQVAALAREASAAGDSPSALAAVATRNDFTPTLPDARCSTLMASARADGVTP